MNPPSPVRLAVLLSGSGTTLQNLMDRCAEKSLNAQIALVLSNRPDAFGLERARRTGIPAAVVERKSCGSREEFSARIFAQCQEARVDLVCLAGFMQLLHVPEDFTHRVMN